MTTDFSIPTMLATQHRAALMDEALRYRLAREARAGRRTSSLSRRATVWGRLRLGLRLRFRPIQPTDGALLLDAFAELSAESRRLRFNGPKSELSAKEVRYFTDVDHRDHEALVAVDRFRGRGV